MMILQEKIKKKNCNAHPLRQPCVSEWLLCRNETDENGRRTLGRGKLYGTDTKRRFRVLGPGRLDVFQHPLLSSMSFILDISFETL